MSPWKEKSLPSSRRWFLPEPWKRHSNPFPRLRWQLVLGVRSILKEVLRVIISRVVSTHRRSSKHIRDKWPEWLMQKKKMHWGSPLHTAPKIQLIICISYSMKAFQFLRWNNWREKLPNNDKFSFLGISRHKCWDTWSLICGKHTIVHCSHKQVYIFKCILGAIKCHRFFFAFLWSQICKTYIPEKNYSRMSREAMYFCSAWEVKLHCGKHLKWFRW